VGTKYYLIFTLIIFLNACATATSTQRPEPVSEYTCWDGTSVGDLSQCPASPVTFSCNDGRQVNDPANCSPIILKTELFSWSNPNITSSPPAYFNAPATAEKGEVPRSFFVENGKPLPSLWDVFSKIDGALKSHSPDYDYKVYRYQNGYALLTDDELIDKTGRIRLSEENRRLLPKEQNRYGAVRSLFNLFNPPEDRFRYFAFIVSTGANPSSPIETTPELLEGIMKQGTLPGALPKRVLEQHAFTDDYWVEVRVYEFPSEDFLDLPRQTMVQRLQTQINNGFYTLPFANHKDASVLLETLFE